MALAGFAGIGVISILFVYADARHREHDELVRLAQDIDQGVAQLDFHFLQLRRFEKEFVNAPQHRWLVAHQASREKVAEQIERLAELGRKPGFERMMDPLQQVRPVFESYNASFSKLVQARRVMGFGAEDGLQRQFTASAVEAEARIRRQDRADLAAALFLLRCHEKEFMLRPDFAAVEAVQTSSRALLDLIEGSGLGEPDRAALAALLRRYQADFDAWAAASLSSERQAKTAAITYSQLEPLLDQIRAVGRAFVQAQQVESDALELWLRNLTIAVDLLMLAGVGILAHRVSRHLTGSFLSIQQVMSRMAKRNYAMEVPNRQARNEFGDMARALEVFRLDLAESERMREAQEREASARIARAERIEHLLSNFESSITRVVSTLGGSSAQLSEASSLLTESADSTANQAAAVTTASEEANASVQMMAAAAEQLSASIMEMARRIEGSETLSRDAVRDATGSAETVAELSGAANRIGEIVDLIRSIAAQTNLLALNATIEAARAGAAGRGFAVVASEVKALADQTATATSHIAEQVNAIQACTGRAVDAIASVGTRIRSMAEITTEIAGAIQQQARTTTEIAQTVLSASLGSRAVTASMATVAEAATQTGGAANQVTSASRVLDGQAALLRQELGEFLASVRAA